MYQVNDKILIKKPRSGERVMECGVCKIFVTILLLESCFSLDFGAAIDRISVLQTIKDPEGIVSSGGIFKLGFFSPVNTTNRYVGIWYNNYNNGTVTVWVANRSKPLNDSSGTLTISEDGDLVVLNGLQEILWTSNSSSGVNSSIAVLGDDGNLVLLDGTSGNTIWESFGDPCDTFLKTMGISTDERTGKRVQLTSWKSPSDPSIGSFSTGVDPSNIPQIFTWKDGDPYWRSGPWSGLDFLGVPEMSSVYLSGFTLADDGKGTVSVSYNYQNDSYVLNIALDSQGKLNQRGWYSGKDDWEITWEAPANDCDVYGQCGEFGICNAQNSPICSCLTGFEPKYVYTWNQGNWTGGCVRRTMLECERGQNGSEPGKKDGFVRLKTVKVPDFAQWSSSSEQECGVECLNNCSCKAYSYYSGFGCMLWTANLIDIQKFSSAGADLYIRLAYSDLGGKSNMKVIISITTIIGAVTISILAFLSWRWWLTKHGGNKLINKVKLLSDWSGANPSSVESKMTGISLEIVKLQELPLFKLQQLVTATNNFDKSNKLGQGGFGPVYKGKLLDTEVAVKRLSRASNQGLEEFKNEVEVISKLQHRNLVRLFGCCIEGQEKMLVYEYMPNKSLDAFLFDPHKKHLLDWRKRFNIIEGICRGMIYLHRDSRLKIIHRDLKPSNILLDQELNPKISDFGMARIFGGNEDQANTRKVVGTYGYMPPEYAIQGRFSEKSDVFSFGVLLLEIVSGRRNTDFYDNEQALSLFGFAWKLWMEGNITAIIDPVACDSCFLVEIARCIHIGLLCVQELAKDRPTMSIVMSMLNSEISDLPIPKQPAFSDRNFGVDTDSLNEKRKKVSVNNVTLTAIVGR